MSTESSRTVRFWRADEEHGFLSNFATVATPLSSPTFGVACSTSEHLYQAMKFDYDGAPDSNRAFVEWIGAQTTPYRAKVVVNCIEGRRAPRNARPDVLDVIAETQRRFAAADLAAAPSGRTACIGRMRAALRAKFTSDVDARRSLIDTAPHALAEASPYDRFWGELGHNYLGRLLVELRTQLAAEYADEAATLSRLLEPGRDAKMLRDDARAVRQQVAALGARPELAARLGLHLYPRSLSYHVNRDGSGTDVLMYGQDARGRTVGVRVTGFKPYMFVRCGDASDERIAHFVNQLERAMILVAGQQRNGSLGSDTRTAMIYRNAPLLQRYAIVDGVSMKSCGADRGFNNSRHERFLQLFWYSPACVKAANDLLEYAYEQRHDAPLANKHALLDELCVGVTEARKRAEAAMPDTDVKGNVRSDKRRTITEKHHDEAATDTPTLDGLSVASERRAAHAEAARRGGAVRPSDVPRIEGPLPAEDVAEQPWDDVNVDVVFDDDDDGGNGDSGEMHASSSSSPPPQRSLENALLSRTMDAFVESANTLSLRELLLVVDRPVEVYEADLDFTVRFCIDVGFKPEQCVRLRDGASVASGMATGVRGLNDIEFTCAYTALELVADDDAQTMVAPQVCMSFDCEMELGYDNAFPRPETERVLQAACVFFDPVADPRCEHVVRRAFVLKHVQLDDADVADGLNADEVFSFDDDEQLIAAFSDYTRHLQPDMITGYNIENFDLDYLFTRAATVGNEETAQSICRKPNARVRVHERQFQSSAHGTHTYKEVTGEGLWVFDLFQAFKRSTSFKLRSYSLESVANVFLGDRKEDVAYSAINGLQRTPTGRARLLKYCMKDALLPARLIAHMTTLIELIEMVRITGVPLDMVVRRGLQIRLKSFLYRMGRYAPTRHLFFTRTQAERLASMGASYAGAHVETPVIGFHDEVVITLDYKSLYPSIMVTFAMCIKTLIPGAQLRVRRDEHALDDDDVWMATTKALPGELADQPVFVRSSHTRGMVTEILQTLLAERKRVKKLMKAAKARGDATMTAIYDKRQLAIKLNCNAIYGVFGAPSSFAYCPEIAAMVTAYGREMILETKALVERLFTIANGFPFDAQVVYGDTDSVFVKLHVPPTSGLARVTVAESAVWGEVMARFVTLHFVKKYGLRDDNIIELEFEKTFSKIIFYAKKRYVGWKWVLTAVNKLRAESHSAPCAAAATLARPLERAAHAAWTADERERLAASAVHARKTLDACAMERLDEPDASGMETERRDSCLLVSRGVKRCVELLLADGTTRAEALERVRAYIVDDMVAPIEANTVPWSQLIQSKQFRMRAREYTSRGQTPPIHIVLAAKLERRLGANAPGTYQPGDRVQYVVVAESEPGQKTSECGESPEHAWAKRMRLSREHYVERQVHGTMARVLEPVLLGGGDTSTPTLDALGFAGVASSSRNDTTRKRERTQDAAAAYARFIRGRRAKRQRLVGAAQASPLDALVVARRKRCRLCGAVGDADVCDAHPAAERARFSDARGAKRRRLDDERVDVWRTCTACCQGWRAEDDAPRAAALGAPPSATVDIESLVPCKNSTCDIYWSRRMNDRRRVDDE